MAVQGTHGASTNLGAPFIDGISTARILSQNMIQNVVQGLLHSNGRGISDEYSANVKTDEIRILMGKPLQQKTRTLGVGDENSYHFNRIEAEQPRTQHYGIKLRHVIDRNIDLARVAMDMVPVDIANDTAKKIDQLVMKMVNGSTLATQIASVLNYNQEVVAGGGDSVLVSVDLTTDVMLDKFLDANVVLHDGAEEHFIDTFDTDGRLALVNTKALREIRRTDSSLLNMGNSVAQELLRIGSLGGVETVTNTRIDGYMGMIDRVPVHMVSKPIYRVAEDFLGLASGALDGVYGLICASEATARGLDFTNGVNVMQNPRGQGLRFQPLFRWGIEVFYPQGIVLLVDSGFTNPIDGTTVTSLDVVGADTLLPTE